jgi:DMSO reductase anchor subunit
MLSFLVPHDLYRIEWALWIGFGAGVVGGISSFFHMHRPQAGKYIFRRLKSSWLSREALTTAIYVAALGVLTIAPLLLGATRLWYQVGASLVAFLGLVAMFVTAQLYATIPAMRSWYSPITVVMMMGTGILTGGYSVLGILAVVVPAPLSVLRPIGPGLVGFSVVLGFIKALQWRVFQDARQSLNVATGTGMPQAPYRLIDSGTTRLPYRTQPQVWPDLSMPRRRILQLGIFVFLLGLPIGIIVFALEGIIPPPWSGVSAVTAVVGAFMDRWLFFADATHSSKVWFGDQAKRVSQVTTDRPSPPFAQRFRRT